MEKRFLFGFAMLSVGFCYAPPPRNFFDIPSPVQEEHPGETFEDYRERTGSEGSPRRTSTGRTTTSPMTAVGGSPRTTFEVTMPHTEPLIQFEDEPTSSEPEITKKNEATIIRVAKDGTRRLLHKYEQDDYEDWKKLKGRISEIDGLLALVKDQIEKERAVVSLLRGSSEVDADSRDLKAQPKEFDPADIDAVQAMTDELLAWQGRLLEQRDALYARWANLPTYQRVETETAEEKAEREAEERESQDAVRAEIEFHKIAALRQRGLTTEQARAFLQELDADEQQAVAEAQERNRLGLRREGLVTTPGKNEPFYSQSWATGKVEEVDTSKYELPARSTLRH